MPCAPWKPKLAIATRVLEMYRLAHLRCPALGVQAWMKTLSDLHSEAFKPYSAEQFTICFDLYLEILKTVDERVKKVLGRDTPDWRLKNCCPSCTYKLEGEQKLIFDMLGTMDGNDSLKRVLRKVYGEYDDNGQPLRGGSERPDPRTADAGGDYLLSRDKVDRWAKEVLAQQVQVPTSDDPEERSNCEECWKNLSEDLTARMWGVFDETGILLALCRHGFVPLFSDMVKSGELAKYGLAISKAILDVFGRDIGMGYDIGCGFETTVKNSPLGEMAKELNYRLLVGAFHGHAHNRLCQLGHLATYVKGLGIEDLKTCERFFSKSNTLSRSVRYASVFHRRQSIRTYLAHTDTFDTYANLSTFLVNNYKQAVEILETEESVKYAMDQAGISGPEVFHERLKQEKEYLLALKKEPEAETDQMEYYQRLLTNTTDTTTYPLPLIPPCTTITTSATFDTVFAEGSTSNGTARRHARENFDKAIDAVQEMERKMKIGPRWTSESPEWQKAAELVATRRYRLCVNHLEELVLKRLFELTKMNMSQTGYKLRKHVAKALQVRSKTIRNALVRYNTAAAALKPPRRHLTWTEVIDYTFLSDFDILRDPEGNAALRPWASPGARHLMDSYFRVERAKEEIPRLNIEIRRFVTYIRDEKEFLVAKEEEVRKTSPILAFFIKRYRNQRGRFDNIHLRRLHSLPKILKGAFTGTLVPGVHKASTEAPVDEMDVDPIVPEGEEEAIAAEMARGMAAERSAYDEDGWETDDEDDEGEDKEDEQVAEITERFVILAMDGE
ncbi:hypothetical protein C8R43DRAFT_1086815 [Mycena crocata]|nr:hypothetical protein C8R43DRAFT_1086815 [Mycena crocata]